MYEKKRRISHAWGRLVPPEYLCVGRFIRTQSRSVHISVDDKIRGPESNFQGGSIPPPSGYRTPPGSIPIIKITCDNFTGRNVSAFRYFAPFIPVSFRKIKKRVKGRLPQIGTELSAGSCSPVQSSRPWASLIACSMERSDSGILPIRF
jgi:hypothetical protein